MAVAAAALSSKLTAAAAVAGQSYVVVAGLRKHVGANGSKLEIQMTCGKRTVSRVFESCTHTHAHTQLSSTFLAATTTTTNLVIYERMSLDLAGTSRRGTKIYVHIHFLIVVQPSVAAQHSRAAACAPSAARSGSHIASLPSSSSSTSLVIVLLSSLLP